MTIIHINRGLIHSELCQKAYRFAKEKHGHQKRKYTGEPYINHPVEVGVLLEWAGEDEETICAGLLHDTIEDTDATFFEVGEHFGLEIATLVDEVTDIAAPRSSLNRAQRKSIERRHLANASRRGKSVKLADTYSNTPSILERDPKFAQVYLKEKRLLLPYLKEGNQLLFSMVSDFLKNAAI